VILGSSEKVKYQFRYREFLPVFRFIESGICLRVLIKMALRYFSNQNDCRISCWSKWPSDIVLIRMTVEHRANQNGRRISSSIRPVY
jgi:hypothetical protein